MSSLQTTGHDRKRSSRAGFTLSELAVASGVSALVLTGVLTVFAWALRSSSECRENSWAQTEILKSSQRIVSCARNAMGVHDIDASGNWVELSMPPTGTVSRFSYVNPTPAPGDGRLTFVRDVSNSSSPTQVVATAVTEVMSLPSRNFFQQTGPRSLRIAYRVAKPVRNRICSAEIEVGVRLRNQ